MRRLRNAALGFVAVLAAAQLVRPERVNPATDSSRTFQARVGTGSALVAVLERACNDCHSNATRWPWYTQVAPMSWIMAGAVKEGRKAVNFSEWALYPSDQRRELLDLSCQDAADGTMPMRAYVRLRPEARLSARDVETICASRQLEPTALNNIEPAGASKR